MSIVSWTAEQLERVTAARELQIATRRPDGRLRRWTPIWAVVVGDSVYVRTWHRRETGWFGWAVARGQARIRVPGTEVEVGIEDVGAGDGDLRVAVDTAYRAKYGGGVDRMVGDEAAATTLGLCPVAGEPAE